MNNNHRPKIISGIITIKVAAITREAFVLHKVLFCDHRRHDGRSQPSPEIPVLPNLCQGMVMDQQNIKTYTRGYSVFPSLSESLFRTVYLLLYTFQKKIVNMNHPGHFFFCLKKYVFSMVDSFLSCPYPVSAQTSFYP